MEKPVSRYQHLKQNYNQYSCLGLSKNPFAIAPLFRSFKEKKKCELEEELFVLPQGLEHEIQTLIQMQDRRSLIYGLYGVGKTSLVDFILYLAYNFHKRMCLRVVINENNVERAIHELLLAVCFEILAEISSRTLLQPLVALKKWLVEYQRADFIMENILKLMGKYTEIEQRAQSSIKKRNLNASAGIIQGGYSFSEEIEVRKSIQSYVEILPMRKVADYLEDFFAIAQQLGFKDIIIYVDEADHLTQLESFLSMLTRSREILFTSGYTFFVAGSVEIAKHTESMGAIFDKLIYIHPADRLNFREILDLRIKMTNSKLGILDVFDEESLVLIFEKTKGVRKNFIRLAENALDLAASTSQNKVCVEHCQQIISTGEDKVSVSLKESHIRILKFLAENNLVTPSNLDFQSFVKVKRVQLRNLLEELFGFGYVKKFPKGRAVYYQISSQYKPYFTT